MSTVQETTACNFVSAFLQGTNLPQPPLQLLVGLRAQLVTQDWVTHDYSTTTDYTFNCEELKEIAAFSRSDSQQFSRHYYTTPRVLPHCLTLV